MINHPVRLPARLYLLRIFRSGKVRASPIGRTAPSGPSVHSDPIDQIHFPLSSAYHITNKKGAGSDWKQAGAAPSFLFIKKWGIRSIHFRIERKRREGR